MKTTIKVFLALFILFSQATFANDILQEFLDKFSKSGIIQFVQSGYGEDSKEKFKEAIEKLLKE